MKKSVLKIALLLAVSALWAQNQEQNVQTEEEIELPDVTTVISGGALTAGKDSVPDYKKILSDAKTGSVELPSLDKTEDSGAESSEYTASSGAERSVYAEGKIGGGWPFYFTGDFAVYRTTGNAPFEIKFSHENAEGFGGESSSDGYFFRNTLIEAEKSFITKKSKYVLSGWYENLDEGFQKKSDSFTDYLWNNIGGKALADWTFSGGAYLGLDVLASYYNRYGTSYSGAASPAFSWEKSAKLFTFIPQFKAGWKNSSFDIGFNAEYATQMNMKESGTLEKAPDSSSAETGQKGHFDLKFAWTEENVQAWAEAGVTFGSSTGLMNSSKFIWRSVLSVRIPHKQRACNLSAH